MTDAARAAAQDDPNRNRHFSRRWGDGGATGPDYAPLRAWHASDFPAPPPSLARKRAEAAWQAVTQEATP